MLSPELTKLKHQLEEGNKTLTCDWEEVIRELNKLEGKVCLGESLTVSSKVCPTCGRPL